MRGGELGPNKEGRFERAAFFITFPFTWRFVVVELRCLHRSLAFCPALFHHL